VLPHIEGMMKGSDALDATDEAAGNIQMGENPTAFSSFANDLLWDGCAPKNARPRWCRGVHGAKFWNVF
ncbi:uncharacterized protein METZ01_LOCUS309705, partial [marine metagenome]